MKLSVIIVNWNTRELLAQCLRAIESNTAPALLADIEVFVVDNASHDGSAAMLQNDFPHVNLIQNPGNVGFASANNQAIRQSSGEYILLLNPDTKVHKGALDTLVDFLDTHPNVGGVGPRLLNPDGTLQVSCYPAPTLARELWRLLHLDVLYPYGSYRMHSWPVDVPREVDVVQGACLLVPSTVLEQIGLMDENFFMYTEEVDLIYRIRKSGRSIFWVPSSEVIHYGGQSTQQVAAEMFLHLYMSKISYIRKHYGPIAALTYKCVLAFAGLLRLVIGPLALLQRQPTRRRHMALASNYRQLLMVLPSM